MSRFVRMVADPRNWHGGSYIGAGVDIPPMREDCRCACSAKDELGRMVHVGWCPDPDCERRPR
jgi:hypothetical protein